MTEEVTVVFPKDQFVTLCNLFQLMAVGGLELNGTGNAIPSDDAIRHIWRTLSTTALSGRVR